MKKIVIATFISCSLFATAQESDNPSALHNGEDYAYIYDHAQKADFTGKDLYRMYLYGYVKGVSGTLAGVGYICPPDSASIEQTTSKIAEYLTKNPKAKQDNMDTVMSNALSEAYPCKPTDEGKMVEEKKTEGK